MSFFEYPLSSVRNTSITSCSDAAASRSARRCTSVKYAGTLITKFWFQISKDEQLARFEARRKTPHKRWKLTDEDLRNREKWDLYEVAVEEMLVRTSTADAPWTVIEGNDKYWARVKSLATLVELLRSDDEVAAALEGRRSG